MRGVIKILYMAYSFKKAAKSKPFACNMEIGPEGKL